MDDFEALKPVDEAARAEALDTSCSVLVQAPAGSGKTELLASRFLKLLAEVEEPEQVLAITFTKAATAEIRHRIVGKLERARDLLVSGTRAALSAAEDLEPATGAYQNSVARGWKLLEQPHRLDIQTIDSLCLRIAHQMPLSERPGCLLQPTEDARALYRRAAQKTLDRLGGEDPELDRALRALLLLRDSNLASCETLLAKMLETRDQWRRALPAAGSVDWDAVLARFEEPFAREVDRVLGELHAALASSDTCGRELVELLRHAAGNLDPGHHLSVFADARCLPEPAAECLHQWAALRCLLLTDRSWRKAFTRAWGFLPGTQERDRFIKLVSKLAAIPGLYARLVEVEHLPACRYTTEERETLRHIFTALSRAVHELDSVFIEAGKVDFVELGIAARSVLLRDDGQAPPIRHLLVDEFQDTSRTQHELIRTLLRGWTAGDGSGRPRTVFLVGDPMQSIYLFRQADVELFQTVRTQGIALSPAPLPVKPLRLETNFRSHAGLVEPLNRMFATVFPHKVTSASANVEFLPAVPAHPARAAASYHIHCNFRESHEGSRDDAERRETSEALRILQSHMPAIEEARKSGGRFSVALLASARNHLFPIASALREHAIPFRAIELEELGQRPEVLDLQSLTRALLHPMDRIAWLSILRAPWCGLELRDLHLLCGSDEASTCRIAVREQIESRLHLVGEEPKARVTRLLSSLSAALANRYRQSSLGSWIERTWNSLGGALCVNAAGYENARAYFRMLEELATDGVDATGGAMQERLSRLYAVPDPAVSERCGVQLMTIHKAKGLGFDVVLVPGLHRPGAGNENKLLCFLERSSGPAPELLVAPLGSKGDGESSIYKWISRLRRNREVEEQKRLLYVACTRARQELHLFGTAQVRAGRVSPERGDSLLRTAWPALQTVFQESYSQSLVVPPAANVAAFPSTPVTPPPVNGILDTLAAGRGKTILRRLPAEVSFAPSGSNIEWPAEELPTTPADDDGGRRRPQAGRETRALGTAVHALLERAAAHLDLGRSPLDLPSELSKWQAHAQALARSQGFSTQEAGRIGRDAAKALENMIGDPVGHWILSPQQHARYESSWTGVIAGAPRTLRIDRSFFAGPAPVEEGAEFLWIVDYKTADHGPSGLAEFFESEKLQYTGQLESYARMMRLLHGDGLGMRLGLYYPFLKRLVWWEG